MSEIVFINFSREFGPKLHINPVVRLSEFVRTRNDSKIRTTRMLKPEPDPDLNLNMTDCPNLKFGQNFYDRTRFFLGRTNPDYRVGRIFASPTSNQSLIYATISLLHILIFLDYIHIIFLLYVL